MRKTLSLSTAVLLAFGIGIAAAQQDPATQHQPPEQKHAPNERSEEVAPMHTVPPPGPASNPESPESEYLKPGSVGPSQAATSGGGDEPSVPGATRQTMPSTISAENAAQDKLPIMSFALPLSDEQKQTIAQELKAAPAKGEFTQVKTGVAEALPPGTALTEFPSAVTEKIPEAARYKFVQADGRILIVNPPNGIVVGEIATN